MATLSPDQERERLEHRARRLEAALEALKRQRRHPDQSGRGLGDAVAAFHAELRAVRDRLKV